MGLASGNGDKRVMNGCRTVQRFSPFEPRITGDANEIILGCSLSLARMCSASAPTNVMKF